MAICNIIKFMKRYLDRGKVYLVIKYILLIYAGLYIILSALGKYDSTLYSPVQTSRGIEYVATGAKEWYPLSTLSNSGGRSCMYFVFFPFIWIDRQFIHPIDIL